MWETLKKIERRIWYRCAFFLTLLGMVLVAVPYASVYHWITVDHIVHLVTHARTNNWTVALFYLIFALAILFFPVTLFPVIGGVLCNFWPAALYNLLASTTGALLAFWAARLLGRKSVERLLQGRWKSFDEFVSTRGVWTVLLCRWTGIPPFLIANYTLGLSGVRLRDYLIGTIIGILPWTLLITYTANSLWEALLIGGQKGLAAAAARRIVPVMLLSIAIVSTSSLIHFWRVRKARRLGIPNLA